MIDIVPEATIIEAAEQRWPTERTIPQPILDGLIRYGRDRIPTGGFLQAVLSNDLFGATARGDAETVRLLPEICRYIHLHLLARSYGSREAVEAWVRGGTTAADWSEAEWLVAEAEAGGAG